MKKDQVEIEMNRVRPNQIQICNDSDSLNAEGGLEAPSDSPIKSPIGDQELEGPDGDADSVQHNKIGDGIRNQGFHDPSTFLVVNKKKKQKRPLGKDEEFQDYKYVEDPVTGKQKRKKIIKRTTKKIKQLTEEQKEEIDNAFLLFDKDKSGSIDVNELKDAMKALGIHLKKEQVRQKMTKVDKDGSGAIDKEEFMALMAEQIEIRK